MVVFLLISLSSILSLNLYSYFSGFAMQVYVFYYQSLEICSRVYLHRLIEMLTSGPGRTYEATGSCGKHELRNQVRSRPWSSCFLPIGNQFPGQSDPRVLACPQSVDILNSYHPMLKPLESLQNNQISKYF